jgi:hypothetical protein
MFNQTAKTKGKVITPLPIPGAKKKASRTTAAHGRGFAPPPAKFQSPKATSKAKPDAVTMDGSSSDTGGVVPGALREQNENDGGPCIENCESIADAIGKVRAARKGKTRKYNLGTNTYT